MALSDIGKSQKKMMSLFAGSGEEDSTKSLAYTAPKEPNNTGDGSRQKQENEPQSKSTSAVQYAYTGRTRLYRLESGAYTAVSNEQLGVVVLLNGTKDWQLLVYDAAKNYLLSAPVTELSDSLFPQANEYVTFSAKGTSWSAHIIGGAYEFTRVVFMCARISTKPCDLIHCKEKSIIAALGDSLNISYKQWNKDLFKQVPEKEKTLKLVCSDTKINETKTIDQCLASACLGAAVGLRRGIFWHDTWIELDIITISKQSSSAITTTEQVPTQQRSSSISQRMAGLAAAGGIPPMVVSPSMNQSNSHVQPDEPQQNQLAVVPGQETARPYFATNSEVQSQNRYDTYGLAAGNALAVQQTSLLAVQSSLSQLHEKIDRISPARVGGSYGEVDSLESRLKDLFCDYRQLKSSGGAREKRREQVEEKLEILREKNAALLADKLELMEKLHSSADSRQQHQALADKLSQTQTRCQQLENELESTKQQIAQATFDKNEASATISTLQSQVNALQERVTTNEGEMSRIQNELKQALEEKEAIDLRASQAENQLSQVKAQLEETQHKLQATISTENTNGGVSESNKLDREVLVKAVMNDTYKQLYAHFSSSAESTFSASDITKTLKSVLKAVTAQHLAKLSEEESGHQ